MFKNMLISILIDVIVNLHPGEWAVDGIYKTLWNIIFIIFVWFVLSLFDCMIEEFKEDLK